MNAPATFFDHASPGGPAAAGSDGMLTVEFTRGRHRWRIASSSEDRGHLLLDLLEMADDSRVPLGSLDVDLVARAFSDRVLRAQSTAAAARPGSQP